MVLSVHERAQKAFQTIRYNKQQIYLAESATQIKEESCTN